MSRQQPEHRRRAAAAGAAARALKGRGGWLWLTMACLVVQTCGAATADATPWRNVTGAKLSDTQRLSAHEDNYAIWNQMRSAGWAGKDERALRAKISFKYTFCGPQFRQPDSPLGIYSRTADNDPADSWCPTSGKWARTELFFGYTGEFDFYAGTRPSGPVIGRVNAPGLFVRLPAHEFLGGALGEADRLEFGLQHRSNGQTTGVSSDRDARIANEQFAAANRPYFDTVSRGANLLLMSVDKAIPTPPIGDSLTLRAKLRLYLGRQDSDITWGPLANRGHRFSDYDRLQLTASWRFAQKTHVDLDWRLGDRGLATDSWTLGLEFNWKDIPFYLRVHRGPMNTLSNYTQRQDSIGLGVRFASL